MLRYNTFRSARYLRSRFVEGRYLLASEATDVQLEAIDLLREYIKRDLGNVAVGDAWKVFWLSSTQLLLNPGEAWFEGLPFIFRSGEDQLVSTSGGYVDVGTVPVGVTVANDASGKIINFTAGSTPANTYSVVITAREELVTSADDLFLKNVNLTEATAQKVQLYYQVNVVPSSAISESPNPYTNDVDDQNLVNQIVTGATVVTPYTVTSGSEGIDGRNLEIKVDNPVGTNTLPIATADQAVFSHGKLIDSLGQKFHLISLFTNPEDSDQVVLRIDKEVGQGDPDLSSGFTLVKRDVYATPSDSEFPQGKLFYRVAEVVWDGTKFSHPLNSVVDLRASVPKMVDLVEKLNQRLDMVLSGGGAISWNLITQELTATDEFFITNSAYDGGGNINYGGQPVVIVEGGSLVYDAYFDGSSFNSWDYGIQSATLITGGTTITTSIPSEFDIVEPGMVIKDGVGNVAWFLTADSQSGVATVSSALAPGLASIYPNSWAAGYAKKSLGKFTLATRLNNTIYFYGGALELKNGETNDLGDGVSQQILDFIGATSEIDSNPSYGTNINVFDGDSLVTSIANLDNAADGLDNRLTDVENAILEAFYDEVINYPAGLVALTNVTIPFNSRMVPPAQQLYTVGAGSLSVYVNGIYRTEGVDWEEVNTSTIRFLYDLSNDSQVHLRIDSVRK